MSLIQHIQRRKTIKIDTEEELETELKGRGIDLAGACSLITATTGIDPKVSPIRTHINRHGYLSPVQKNMFILFFREIDLIEELKNVG